MDEEAITLFVCTNCPHPEQGKPRTSDEGQSLFEAVREAVKAAGLSDKLTVAEVRCMGGCDKPCSIALAGNFRETLLFNELHIEHVDDILACATAYMNAAPGHRMLKSERPASMGSNLLVRVPAVKPARD